MSEFKVGDRVRIIEKGFEGTIEEVLRGEIHNHYDNSGKYYYLYRVATNDEFYNGIEENMLELLEKSKEPPTLEELEQRIEKLEKEVFKPVVEHDKPKEKSLLTEDERVILRSIPKKYNWIIRDKDWDLYVFVERPYQDEKDYFYWKSSNVVDGDYFGLFFNSMFMGIERDILYNIEELLKGECGNE